jgi:hypothetical protein
MRALLKLGSLGPSDYSVLEGRQRIGRSASPPSAIRRAGCVDSHSAGHASLTHRAKRFLCSLRASHLVLGRVIAENALVALQFPFAIRPFGEPVGNSNLRVHRTRTERDARLITGGDDFLQAKLAVAENGDKSNEHGDLR